ncbi:MAG: AAA family ATPase [Paludibacteraceae bacterium]|nr:AAA family ATPase [Paludibacteraceae bacterium]
MDTRQHIQTLLKYLSQGLYEKDNILSLALLCAISGESLFLLGPPGTAKSEVARRLKMVFRDASAFEYLMSRFSTPDEIFGPVSIQKLKSEDTYERKTEGFLPSATIVFLDEIWKAGPAIQNALLTVINEKIYQNGTHTIRVPMKCLIAASNELPAEDEGLEALWDRFLVRVVSNCIEDEKTFYKMLLMPELPSVSIPDEYLLTDDLFTSWQEQIKSVVVPDGVLKAITAMRKGLNEASKGDDVEPLDYYISDRRWRKNIQVLRTSAFLNGRNTVDYSDLMLLIHCLWNKEVCIEPVLKIVASSLFAEYATEAESIDALCEKIAKQNAKNDEDTTPYKKFNYFYLGLKDHPNGKCFFFESDYKYMPRIGESPGVMYYDDNVKGYVIRKYDNYSRAFETTGKQNVTTINISKRKGMLIVDGVPYQFIREYSAITTAPPDHGEGDLFNTSLTAQTEDVIKALQNRLNEFKASQNLFLSKNDLKLVNRQANELNKKLAVILAKTKNL